MEAGKGKSLKEAAGAVAAESSVGTWTAVTTAPAGIGKLAAKVFSIKGNYIKVAYPIELFELNNVPQIMSSIAGNIFGMKEVKNLKLLDVDFPDKLIKQFKGPLFGIKGVRKTFGIKKRPLLGTIIKPKLGLDSARHAKVAYEAWVGGCDIVKDDENLSSQSFNNFKKRVKLSLKARDKAEKETGSIKAYMPNITAETREMLRRAKFVKKEGGKYAMVDIVSVGWSALQTLREENEDLKLILHAHRAGYAAFSRNPKHGISMLVIAKLVRLIGVDQLHIGTIVGKMDTPKKEVVAIDQEIEERIIKDKSLEKRHLLEENWLHIKPVFAVCSGGLNPLHVPYLMKVLGNNIIIQAGGGIHGHKLGTRAGSKAMLDVIEGVMEGKSLAEIASESRELAVAIKQWKK